MLAQDKSAARCRSAAAKSISDVGRRAEEAANAARVARQIAEEEHNALIKALQIAENEGWSTASPPLLKLYMHARTHVR